MIQIIKTTINTVALTLTELSNLTAPYYLFEFKNDQDNSLVYLIGTDISLYPNRYNKFLIEEKSLPNPLNGEVELVLAGFYSYRVFEQLSSTNLNPTLCDNLVPLEIGKVQVFGTSNELETYNYNPTIKVYNG